MRATQFIFLRYGMTSKVLAIDLGSNDTIEPPFRDLTTEDLRSGEIGRYSGFSLVETSYKAPVKQQQIIHGPQRKGRGGKIRRW